MFNIDPKTTNCVWTAPAWPDCMCVLPAEHMFSCCFSVFVHDFSYCRSVLTPHRKSGKMFTKGPQYEVQQSGFLYVLRGLGPKVPQGGPKDPPRALKVSPKVPKGAPGWSQGPPRALKVRPKGVPGWSQGPPQGAKSEPKAQRCPGWSQGPPQGAKSEPKGLNKESKNYQKL